MNIIGNNYSANDILSDSHGKICILFICDDIVDVKLHKIPSHLQNNIFFCDLSNRRFISELGGGSNRKKIIIYRDGVRLAERAGEFDYAWISKVVSHQEQFYSKWMVDRVYQNRDRSSYILKIADEAGILPNSSKSNNKMELQSGNKKYSEELYIAKYHYNDINTKIHSMTDSDLDQILLELMNLYKNSNESQKSSLRPIIADYAKGMQSGKKSRFSLGDSLARIGESTSANLLAEVVKKLFTNIF